VSAFSTSLEAIDWEQVDDLLKRKVVHGQNMTMTRYSFLPRGTFPLHVHDQEQITYVLSGEVNFSLDEENHPLGAGDVIVIGPGVPHRANAGPSGAELISVVAPARTGGRGVKFLDGAG
jgi:unsaturated pyranuronate lyase